MAEARESERCETCRFARERGIRMSALEDEVDVLICQRFPVAAFKREDEWCGEYQPKEPHQ